MDNQKEFTIFQHTINSKYSLGFYFVEDDQLERDDFSEDDIQSSLRIWKNKDLWWIPFDTERHLIEEFETEAKFEQLRLQFTIHEAIENSNEYYSVIITTLEDRDEVVFKCLLEEDFTLHESFMSDDMTTFLNYLLNILNGPYGWLLQKHLEFENPMTLRRFTETNTALKLPDKRFIREYNMKYGRKVLHGDLVWSTLNEFVINNLELYITVLCGEKPYFLYFHLYEETIILDVLEDDLKHHPKKRALFEEGTCLLLDYKPKGVMKAFDQKRMYDHVLYILEDSEEHKQYWKYFKELVPNIKTISEFNDRLIALDLEYRDTTEEENQLIKQAEKEGLVVSNFEATLAEYLYKIKLSPDELHEPWDVEWIMQQNNYRVSEQNKS